MTHGMSVRVEMKLEFINGYNDTQGVSGSAEQDVRVKQYVQ